MMLLRGGTCLSWEDIALEAREFEMTGALFSESFAAARFAERRLSYLHWRDSSNGMSDVGPLDLFICLAVHPLARGVGFTSMLDLAATLAMSTDSRTLSGVYAHISAWPGSPLCLCPLVAWAPAD